MKIEIIKNIEHIIGLLETVAGGERGLWCCIDSKGNVSYMSKGLSEYLNVPIKEIKSLFQFNPEWSYIKWQEIIKGLSSLKSETFEGKYLDGKGVVGECQIKLIPFLMEGKEFYQYIILNQEDLSRPSNQLPEEKSDRALAGQGQRTNINYDDVSPNPILYFNHIGRITHVNERMKLLNDPKKDKKVVQDLFLESELGPLLEGLEKYPKKTQQLMIRMIMKSNSKLKEGYGRISFHSDDDLPDVYRLEFVPMDGVQLIDQSLEHVLDEVEKLRKEVEGAKSTMLSEQMTDFSFENIITKSPKYKAVLRQIAQVADTDTTVLITGETGTGKELLCNATYKLSDRSDKVFIKVNCASIPNELIESILFGHEKGSFTGADSQKVGKFEMANGGTIFLDEIGELPLDLQPKLLRVLQEGEIERIGNPIPLKVDVRIIAATNRDLERMSKEGTFRSDLYYRLNVFPIYNIPLKDRLEDVPLLISHFINKVNIKTGKQVSKIKNKDLGTLCQYDFPGNVRELENIIERAIILADGEELNMEFFYQSDSSNSVMNSVIHSYDEMIKIHITQALEHANGKVTGENSASQLLRMNGKTFASKLRKYGIDPRAYKN